MKHLLDVNVLLAAMFTGHPDHPKTFAWLPGKSVVVCPLAALGFLRISTQPKAFAQPMPTARQLLEDFLRDNAAEFLADDLPALDSHPQQTGEVTDHYLADLAAAHGCKLATLDQQLKHPAAELVS